MLIDELWRWLEAQDQLTRWPPDRALIDELGDRLHAIDERLAFELTKRGDVAELAISPEGIAELFDLVRQIVAAAPPLPISVVAFRQRGTIATARLTLPDGRSLSSNDIWFRLERDEQGLGLQLFVRDFPDDEPGELQAAVYLLLDNALGELDVVTGIAWIEWARLPEHPETLGLASLVSLPRAFDRELGRTPD